MQFRQKIRLILEYSCSTSSSTRVTLLGVFGLQTENEPAGATVNSLRCPKQPRKNVGHEKRNSGKFQADFVVQVAVQVLVHAGLFLEFLDFSRKNEPTVPAGAYHRRRGPRFWSALIAGAQKKWRKQKWRKKSCAKKMAPKKVAHFNYGPLRRWFPFSRITAAINEKWPNPQ